MAGRLSLVGTPIGNLGDITLRAIERLKDVSRIYAEDTRRTRTLLSSLGIEGKQLLSLHAHSDERTIDAAIEVLTLGEDVALVTDAGMPGVSDPGADLVRKARTAGIVVDAIPGPSAVTAAVALSGLVDGPFSFFGFLPRKGTKRKEALRYIRTSALPVVLFESPHRMSETLKNVAEVCGPTRQIAICRELTKKFEETIVAPLGEVSRDDYRQKWQGEFTLVIARSNETEGEDIAEPMDTESRARELLSEGTSVKETTSVLCKELAACGEKAKRRSIYSQVLALHQAQQAAADSHIGSPAVGHNEPSES